MDAEDIAKLVGELEERIERLRVLYDQYFMGIEKIPPEVLKKDVERRMWVLRREKIRNTGTRFKFQTITQRLNTFQSYWMRICRDIENGTYKRDLMRAKRRFGPEATADQVRRKTAVVDDEAPASAPLELDVDIELEDIVPDDDDLGVPEVAAAATSARPIAVPGKPPPRAPAAPQAPMAAPMGSSTPGAPAPFAIPARGAMRPLPSPLAAARASAPIAAPVPASQPTRAPVRAPTPAPRDDGELDAMLDAALGASSPPAAAPRTSAPKVVPAAVARPRPSAPTPSIAAAPRAPASQASNPPARPSAPERGDPDRQIYNRLVDAKRANGESTANLTFEQLQRNLEATRAKLKDKSGGRAIEFDVVVKDGKTILKPTVK